MIGCGQLAHCGIHYLCFSFIADTKQTEVGMATYPSLPFIFHPHADAFVPIGSKWINPVLTDVKGDFESLRGLGAKIQKYVSEPGCAEDRNRKEF